MVGKGFNWIDWLFLFWGLAKTYSAKIFFRQNSLDLRENL
ncbi:hypothetical protein Syncc8109_2387 [Synechococcus sp. WH 8109]|nr:hypothetical protein Syncc8109_2387 [Synechococcus sp. WH 8109]